MTSRAVSTDRDRTTRIMELAQQLNTWPIAMDALQRGLSFSEFQEKALQRYRHRQIGFQITRLFECAADPNQLDGFEREQAQEWSGQDFYPGRYVLPWSEIASRDLNVSGASSGGFLVNTDVLPAADILRPWSVSARAGITIIENCVGNQTLPKTSAKATIEWLSSETSAGTASQPTVQQVAATPKIAIGLCNFSRQLSKQSNAEQVIRRELLRTAGTAIDQAIFAGTGASGQPLGLLNTPGIGTQSGTSLAQLGVTAMKTAVANANAPDESIAFIGTPTVRGLLEQRERATGSGFVWDNNRVASVPAYATTDLPASTLVCGAWPAAVLLLWGSGIVLELNPYHNTGFKSGQIQARVLISCDTMFVHPAAFSVSTSIT